MAGEANTGKAIGAAGLIAAAVAILAARGKVEASSDGTPPTGPLSLDEATMNLLLAIASSGECSNSLLATLNQAIAGIMPGGLPGIENPSEITAFRVIPVAANTATRLPGRRIPPGMELVIKAMHTNGGLIYTAGSQAGATNPNSAYTLVANEAVEYKVSTSHNIWISSTAVGEGVVCTVEQAAGGA